MKKLLIAIGITISINFIFSSTVSAKEIAIIVNKNNKIDNITKRELLKIFKGYKKKWAPEDTITIVILPVESSESSIMLDKIYKMRKVELKKFWLAAMFKGRIHAFPKTFRSNELLKNFVSETPSAIGYIDALFVDNSVKALLLDGKSPGDDGYLLTD